MSKDNDRTVYRRSSDNQWVDKRDNAERGFNFKTQAEAIASGREKLLNAGGGELTVKGRDGKIRSKDTLGGGNDPVPPRDREH
ncbi:hypothetical protein E9232_003416 [Inquilinus ginsengisoli]|uniref:DUF2188 domain-containing protein n=1 Tax=Inquilinus ginsengisoli TaxID=363840 RepID=A0ABU1JQI7_9PROT|nr:DUF2188 domain-containing protein [Inquilinus ginsengisoli]MDR6290890.1 hypothetical protein [Inquilinus ginsengisoli]